MGERQVRNLEVVGSTPIGSTNTTSGGVAFRIPFSGTSERLPPFVLSKAKISVHPERSEVEGRPLSFFFT